ncbi:DUF2200 domain-containing protein [Corynebacterium auris]|uniref:DUF2200 domain-containing protein n=1 Tax=Corynebacterium auris TaxID=44750 RepID=UPI0025B48DE8|nr:DUF2200 domain-containing protein [Corynebacterium auris]WJY67677.1 hypothetical protein CAURIS_03795 [Corynebacterium auris]
MDDTLARVGGYRFGDIYANYLAKVERKGRSQGELDDVLTWLTGHTTDGLHAAAESGETLREFFASAPRLNPHATLITGVVCGVRVEEITDPLMQRIRWMDKVVDELARGKKIENILRSPR